MRQPQSGSCWRWMAVVATACSGHVSLGHGAPSGGGGAPAAVVTAISATVQPPPKGCEHRAEVLEPSIVYQGYVQSQASPATLLPIQFGFVQLDAKGVSGRVTLGYGTADYVSAPGAAPAGTALERVPGFDYTMLDGVLAGNHLELELGLAEPWCALCGRQPVYPDALGGYNCMPSGPVSCLAPPSCPVYSVLDPSTLRERARVSHEVFALCFPPSPCGCSAEGCSACGFPVTGSCANPAYAFDLLFSSNDLNGTVSIDGALWNVVTHQAVYGIVPLEPGKFDALVGAACASRAVEPEPPSPALQMVVDVSAPMARSAVAGGGSNWDVTRESLRQTLTALPGDWQVGLSFYPNQATSANAGPALPSTACINPADDVALGLLGSAGSDQRALLDQALARVEVRSGAGAPTQDAYRLSRDSLAQTAASRKNFMLLVTGGQPTLALGCLGSGLPSEPVSPEPIIADIDDANRSRAIATFVLGTPGSEANALTNLDARPWLSAAARAGGTATGDCSDTGPTYCHLDLTEPLDLTGALRNAVDRLSWVPMPCVYPLPTLPPTQVLNPDQTYVVYTNGDRQQYSVIRSAAEPCQRGWHYIEGQTALEICGETCTLVQSDPSGKLDLFFRCDVPVAVN